MVAARTQVAQCFYLAVAKKFNSSTPCKVNFSAPDYGPDAVSAMCKAFGVQSTSAFTEFQILRINEDKTYSLVSEKLGPSDIKRLKDDAGKKKENDDLVDRLVEALAALPAHKQDDGEEPLYLHYKLGEAA